MPDVRPFAGLLYDPAVAGPLEALTAPPYDAISPVDQDRYHLASPYNVVRLILGRGEPADGTGSDKYTRAASSLRDWRERGVLVPTPGPAVYPYEMRFLLPDRAGRVRGVVVAVGLEPWDGSIVPHERTLPGPIDDRLALLRAVRANLSPVYAVLVGTGASEALTRFLDRATAAPPAREVVDEAGTRHRLWVWDADSRELTDRLGRERLMIADGHHRYTVALTYRQEMHAALGPGPWDYIMMLVVDARAEDPPVLPIHRVATGPVPPPEGDRVSDLSEALASLDDDRLTYAVVSREGDGLSHRVAALAGQPPTVCRLHEHLLDRLAGVELRYLADPLAAEAAVASGAAHAAYLLPATKVERVWAVVAAGGRLPQKSTYFWPKPRTGMVIRPLEA